MSFRGRAAAIVSASVLCCLTAWPGAASNEAPLPAPPPDLVERTGGAWLDIYHSWVERPDGSAIPVDPGPAFCLGVDGIAMVDQNAVAGSLHLFATIGGRGPFAARTRAYDSRPGLAAVDLHPGALEGVRCLQLAGEGASPVAKGDVLFALGPAGAEPVPLRVRKASPEELSFVGGLQMTFLAGSPLVDANGILRGVLVAGASGGRIGQARATGPLAGLAGRRHASGAIPLAPALALVERVEKERDDGVPVPPRDPVVRVSGEVFPRSLRGAAGVGEEDLKLYFATAGEVSVEFLTPASLSAQQALLKYAYAAGRTFFRWPAHAEMWEPMVVVQQSPRFDSTAGSVFPKSEGTMAVERGGERFEPFDSFRECFDDKIPIEVEPGTYSSRTVKGCRTFYLFPPEVFAPGADVTVRVAPDQEGKSIAVPVQPETQARIAEDFSPWRAAALENAAAGTPAPSVKEVITPPPALGVPYATRSLGNAELRITKPAGRTFVVTRLQRDGMPAIWIPVVLWKTGLFSAGMIPGFLYVGRGEVSFEPFMDVKARSEAFTLPRADMTVSTTSAPALRIKVDDKKRLFYLRFEVTQRLSLGEAVGSAARAAQRVAVGFVAKLLGDFNQALRAFDEPEILETMPPQAPVSPPTVDETP